MSCLQLPICTMQLTCHCISWASIRLAMEVGKLTAQLHVLILCFCAWSIGKNMWKWCSYDCQVMLLNFCKMWYWARIYYWTTEWSLKTLFHGILYESFEADADIMLKWPRIWRPVSCSALHTSGYLHFLPMKTSSAFVIPKFLTMDSCLVSENPVKSTWCVVLLDVATLRGVERRGELVPPLLPLCSKECVHITHIYFKHWSEYFYSLLLKRLAIMCVTIFNLHSGCRQTLRVIFVMFHY
jgi:hypothetical protein